MTRILLAGGCGFIGRAITAQLLDSSSPVKLEELRIYDIQSYTGPSNPRLIFIYGDIRNYEELLDACRDIDVVIHSAAVVDWGTKSDEEVFSVNVGGTENVIRACREQAVKFLVFTSSLDAVFSGKPLVDIDENLPWPEHHSNSYCKSKYLAEKLVLAANENGLKTSVLRPSDVYGEGDPFHIGSLINMAKGGFYIRLGNGRSRSQHVYVHNIAHAHIMAVKEFLSGNNAICGNTYFITDGPGSNFFRFYDHIVESAGYRIRPRNLWIPGWIARMLGALSELAAIIVRPVKRYTPKMSRFAVIYTTTDFTFSSEKARKDFGWIPKFSEKEAVDRTIKYYSKERTGKVKGEVKGEE